VGPPMGGGARADPQRVAPPRRATCAPCIFGRGGGTRPPVPPGGAVVPATRAGVRTGVASTATPLHPTGGRVGDREARLCRGLGEDRGTRVSGR